MAHGLLLETLTCWHQTRDPNEHRAGNIAGVSSKYKYAVLTIIAIFALSCHSCAATSQGQTGLITAISDRNSLAEVLGKKRALLLVFRSGVIDTGDNDRAVIEFALKADPQSKRYRLTYDTIAQRLNRYINKYKSMSAATQLSDADYIIFFNLLEYRRILNATYPYGELFVILKGDPSVEQPPRVIWKSKKVQWAGDAVHELIKKFRELRREE
jgi:hypothetical protein